MDLNELFDRAVTLEGEVREKFLREQCAGDTEALSELRALLAADEAASQDLAWQRTALENAAMETREASRSNPVTDPAIGEMVGAYRITAVIGAGGMGKVYRAVRADTQYEKNVALKRIKRGLDADQITTRFRSERQILANLEHPNIARLLDGGADREGMPYLVMEFIEGVTPAAYANANHLRIDDRLVLARQICAAVHYAHQRMVIHRDLKPGNILVTADGTPKLLDFGLAKVFEPAPDSSEAAFPPTEAGMRLMTVRYASPEQVRGENVTTASDIYSLGVVFYELLTGHSPYRDPQRATHELMRAVCEEDPVKPSERNRELRGDVENILLKALSKEPSKRYASADQFSEDIRNYLEGLPVLARGQSFSYVAAKFVRRNKIAVAAAAAVFITMATGLVLVSQARARAERRFNEVRRLAHAVVFDYHDAIEPLPGSTPVRARLVKDALTYLDSLAKEADDPELQRELVDAYVRIGNVQGNSYQGNLGDTAGALASARKAVAVADALLKRDHGVAARRSAAAAYDVQASLLFATGDLHTAETSFQRARQLNEAALALEPGDVDTAVALIETLRELGDLYGGGGGMQNLGRGTESLEYYKRAEQTARELDGRVAGDERVLRQRGETLQTLAQAEASLGRSDDAAAHMEESVNYIERASQRNANNSTTQFELSGSLLGVAILLYNAGHTDKALPYLDRTEDILNKLIAVDPQNTLYARSLSVAENHYASALNKANDPRTALPHNRKSLEIAEALRKRDPNSFEFRADVGISFRKMSETMLAMNDARGALDQATRGVAILCGAVKSDAYTETHCGRALMAAGDAQIKLGDLSGAREDYTRARDVAATAAKNDPANKPIQADLARAEAGLAAARAK